MAPEKSTQSMPSRELTDRELFGTLQRDLEVELAALDGYASRLDALENPEAKAILEHILNKTKQHSEMFLELLNRAERAGRAVERISSGSEEIGQDYAMPMHLSVGALSRR